MERQQIFKGLSLTEEETKDLARYWNVAGDAIGIIDEKGKLTTSNGSWKRPIADKNYQALRKSLADSPVDWIIVSGKQLAVDFSHLEYNLEWLKMMLHNRGLGVCNSKSGLKLYQKREASGKTWFEDLAWTLQGVTVASLELKRSEVESLTPNSENPDEAEWAVLYFAE